MARVFKDALLTEADVTTGHEYDLPVELGYIVDWFEGDHGLVVVLGIWRSRNSELRTLNGLQEPE